MTTAEQLIQKVLALSPTDQKKVVELINTLSVSAASVGSEVCGTEPANCLSLAEFDSLSNELWEGLPPLASLPADFSRTDIYAEREW